MNDLWAWALVAFAAVALVGLVVVGGLAIHDAAQRVAVSIEGAVNSTASGSNQLIADVNQLVSLFQYNIWATIVNTILIGVLFFGLIRTDPSKFVLWKRKPRRKKT